MRKITALFLSILLLLPCIQISSAAKEVSKSDDAINFLSQLEITDGFDKLPEETVTRAEFTVMLVKGLNMTGAEFSHVFSDVDTADSYASFVNIAAGLGIIAGNGRGEFYPKEAITLSAALKMTVSALGYDRIANALGGFPTGYMKLANDLDLSFGVGGTLDSPLSFSQAAILICNYLMADICGITAIVGNDIQQARQAGHTPLTEYFHLTKTEGTVKTAGFESLIPGETISKPQITINGNRFGTNIKNPEQFLGLYATAWYDENDNIRGIYVSPRNSFVTVKSDQIDSFSGLKLTAYDENGTRATGYTLEASYSYARNGRGILDSENIFKEQDATYNLIDNDGNGRFDVVIAEVTKYFVVSAVNTAKKTVYDTNNGVNSLMLDNENGFCSFIEIMSDNGTVAAASVSDLKNEMVLQVNQSDDGTYTYVLASSFVVSGTVNEYDNDSIIIDGVKYKFNSYFFEKEKIHPGYDAAFLLAPDTTITAFASGQTDVMNYGYLLDYCKNDKSIDHIVQIKILSDKGTVITPYLANKVIFDGVNISGDSEEIKNSFIRGNVPLYQVIRYQLNADNKVFKIDTAQAAPPGQFNDNLCADNTLSRYISKTKGYFYSTYKIFSPHISLQNSPIIFSVPYDIYSGGNERYNDKAFGVTSVANMGVSRSVVMDAYDVDSNLMANCIVYYNPNSGSSATVGAKTALSMVSELTSGITDEGELVHFILVMTNGTFYKYIITNDIYSKLTVIPKAGDLVRVEVNTFGEVTAISVDAIYDSAEQTAVLTSDAPDDGFVNDSAYRGRIYSISGSALTLLIDQMMRETSSYSDPLKGNIAAFTLINTASVTVFNAKSGEVTPGRVRDLEQAVSVGAENASKVIMKTYSHGIQQIFVYDK